MNKITQDSIAEEQNTQSFILTDERKDLYQKCREDLLKRQLSNTENFDRSILTLSSSSLGLTLTFIRNVTPIEESHLIGLLLLAWCLLAAAIVVTLSSFLVSQAGTDTQLIYAEEYYLNGKDEYGKKRNIFDKMNKILGYISAVTFVIAMTLLVAFVCINITNGENPMSDAKISAYQGERGASIPAMQPVSNPLVSPSGKGSSTNSGSGNERQSTKESSNSK